MTPRSPPAAAESTVHLPLQQVQQLFSLLGIEDLMHAKEPFHDQFLQLSSIVPIIAS